MKKTLLMIGGEHHAFERCADILADFLKSTGTADCAITTDREAFTRLEGYDAVIVYTFGGRLTDAQEKGLCDWVHKGGAFIGLHSAAASFTGNSRYMEMIGMQVAQGQPVMEYRVFIKDFDHEVSRQLSEFVVNDEPYKLEPRTKENLHWLLACRLKNEPQPVAYTRMYGRGRVFYTVFGHHEEALRHPVVQRVIRRGLMWATRLFRPGPVRCGIVGYGPPFAIARHHAKIIEDLAALKLTAICEIEPERLALAGKEHPEVETFARLEDFAASGLLDAAVVATPPSTHTEIVLALLEAGVGVVCEKPFCLTTADATRMIEAARRNHLPLTVFHNRRWDPDFTAIRKIVASGMIGEVFQVETFHGRYGHPGYGWRSHRPISGGELFDMGAHYLDWICQLIPAPIESVTGFACKHVWHDVTNEDHHKTVIRFAGGRFGEYESSTIAGVDKPKWRILGTKGALSSQDGRVLPGRTFAGGHEQKFEIVPMETPWSYEFYIDWVDHLLGGGPVPVTPESARRVIGIIEASQKSAASGQAEPVAFP